MRTKMRIMAGILTAVLLLLTFVGQTQASSLGHELLRMPLSLPSPLYNNVDLPNPPWWVDNNNDYSKCDKYQYNHGHTIGSYSGAGVDSTPLSDPPTFRNVWTCKPSSGTNNSVQVKFYDGTQGPDKEWQCTELVKRYLYQAFGAPQLERCTESMSDKFLHF